MPSKVLISRRSRYYLPIERAIKNAIWSRAYTGIGEELKTAHSLVPVDIADIERLEWFGDVYLDYYLTTILFEREKFGGCFRFITDTLEILCRNEILEGIMLRSGLGNPAIPRARGKQLADAAEATLAVYEHHHSEEETREAVFQCYKLLIEAAEDAYETRLRSEKANVIFRPPEQNYKFKDIVSEMQRVRGVQKSRKACTAKENASCGEALRDWETQREEPQRDKVPLFFAGSRATNVPLPPLKPSGIFQSSYSNPRG